MNNFSLIKFKIHAYFAVIVPNLIGGACMFIYFWYLDFSIIQDIYKPVPGSGQFYFDIFIIISAAIISIIFVSWRIEKLSKLILKQKAGILNSNETDNLKRFFINTNIWVIMTVLLCWINVGMTISVSSLLRGLPFMLIIRINIVNTGIGLSLTIMITFFLIDYLIKKYVPIVFPESDFSSVLGIRRVRIYIKILFSFWFGGLLPVLILFYLSQNYITLAENGAVTESIQFKFTILVTFILCLSFFMTILSSFYFGHTIGKPLMNIEEALNNVKKGNMDTSFGVHYTDEIGLIYNGLNSMLKGLKEAFHDREELVIIDKELEIAESVQQSVLTDITTIEGIENYEVKITYLPQNKRVSGDYYNFARPNESCISILIADAAGHGLQAALTTMQIDIMNKQSIKLIDPHIRLKYMNTFYLKRLNANSMFTAFLINIYENEIHYGGAGHPDQILIKGDTDEMILLKGRGRLIGAIEESEYGYDTIPFHSGDTVLLFTDGTYEEFNAAKRIFSENKFHEAIQRIAHEKVHKESLEAFNKRLMGAIDDFIGEVPYNDDITIVSVRKK